MFNGLHASLNRIVSRQHDAAVQVEEFNHEGLRFLDLDAAVAGGDPLVDYLLRNPVLTEITKLALPSPALDRLKQNGVRLLVPFISQGKLIGLLCLGGQKNGKGFSHDERELLNQLGARLSPALQVAQMVKQQQTAALARQQLEHELSLARHIQQTLLPSPIPAPQGWQIAAFYQPARAVGGDFYDVIDLEDGRFAIVVGDVTDKGVPAAMLMAATRSTIRSVAAQLKEPAAVMHRVNDLMCPDMPSHMFVTCLYVVVDPTRGEVKLANAGHNLPLVATDEEVEQIWAAGMPLGLFPGSSYDQVETRLTPGMCMALYSDGITEAHNRMSEMYGTDRFKSDFSGSLNGKMSAGQTADALLEAFNGFTGPDWEQEDDVTLVTIYREAAGEGLDDSMASKHHLLKRMR